MKLNGEKIEIARIEQSIVSGGRRAPADARYGTKLTCVGEHLPCLTEIPALECPEYPQLDGKQVYIGNVTISSARYEYSLVLIDLVGLIDGGLQDA